MAARGKIFSGIATESTTTGDNVHEKSIRGAPDDSERQEVSCGACPGGQAKTGRKPGETRLRAAKKIKKYS
jgi:hypothetical protein